MSEHSHEDLASLTRRIAACRICRDTPSGPPLPHEPRPVLRVGAGRALILICGQAPGARVHASGIPFDDPSGDTLRSWLGVTRETFYDEDCIGIVPMGFCFPGHDSKGGDLPPRKECARTWHGPLFALLPPPRLMIALGLYAQRYHLARVGRPDLAARTLHDSVRNWREVWTATSILPLPHPSWRNRAWVARNPWFESELLPVLRQAVGDALGPRGIEPPAT
ncbi:uracil-DNA glycosylase family protein [Alsobacter sp. SYSU M60028]|uniref:Uracil-DNA glycosylase family protein n=1 Tax=Alsobacter ponti TaxID=2962936 RepID=A0ABT1L9Q1_9HYPH|nr:uracil-DNA glycosylase family protein [Alsobacter ponti]MCP8937658.1 uracil-DNA glycosylase family protein [Alsobacter ponti]